MSKVEYKIAHTEGEFEQAKQLFKEYAASLDFNLDYQGFDDELKMISHQYEQPTGALFLCLIDSNAIGCIGIRAFEEKKAELKRLYLNPAYRGLGIGSALVELAIEKAKELKYDFLLLDTVPSQKIAQELYRRSGFYEIKPYRFSPVEGTLYMEKSLK